MHQVWQSLLYYSNIILATIQFPSKQRGFIKLLRKHTNSVQTDTAQVLRAMPFRGCLANAAHTQQVFPRCTDTTYRTTKLCVSTFDTSSPSPVKNNSILAILSTVLLPPGRSTNRCECHKSDFSMMKAAIVPWDSLASRSILPQQPHLCRPTVTGGAAAAQHLIASS